MKMEKNYVNSCHLRVLFYILAEGNRRRLPVKSYEDLQTPSSNTLLHMKTTFSRQTCFLQDGYFINYLLYWHHLLYCYHMLHQGAITPDPVPKWLLTGILYVPVSWHWIVKPVCFIFIHNSFSLTKFQMQLQAPRYLYPSARISGSSGITPHKTWTFPPNQHGFLGYTRGT